MDFISPIVGLIIGFVMGLLTNYNKRKQIANQSYMQGATDLRNKIIDSVNDTTLSEIDKKIIADKLKG